MAKKAAKKEVPAAKAKKAAKPVAKAPAKATKPTKAVKPVAKAAKPVAAKVKEGKTAKAAPAKAVEKKAVTPPPPPPAPAPVKALKTEKVSKKDKVSKDVQETAAVPKKEKKVKVDKSGLSEDQAKWHELYEKHKGVKAPTYSISGQFEAKTPLQHKIFGWGFILSNEYDRLEVVFEDGKRMLISNRKLS